MKKISLIGIVILLHLTTFPITAFAYAPYKSYEYNQNDESIPVPTYYVPSDVVTAAQLGLTQDFDGISDMYYNGKSILYILDGGNSRIIKLSVNKDGEFSLIKEYKNLKNADGSDIVFIGACGITADAQENMYIADTKGYKVLIANKDGIITKTITRPDKALKNTDAAFDAQKILLDQDGKIYVTAKSINLGIFVFSNDGNFLNYWGANEVPTTGEVLINYIRKRFLTDTQLKLLNRATPVTVESFDIDADGFIYTTSPYRNMNATVAEPGLLRKLNFKGNDILDNTLIFGDIEWDKKTAPQNVKTFFNDVDIDSNGFVNLLDSSRGRVFQYTDSGQLVAVFGSLGSQVGCFDTPSAIETFNDKIYVSDSVKNVIYGFSPTKYALDLRAAVIKLNNNDLSDSLSEWNRILGENTNSRIAYLGLGRTYDRMCDYKNALHFFKLAGAREDYSKSFQQYRSIVLQKYYPIFLLFLAVFIIILIRVSKLLKKLSTVGAGQSYSQIESRALFPLYALVHPTEGFGQFRHRNIQSIPISIGIIAVWFFAIVLKFFVTGIPFNTNRPIDFNFGITLIQTVGVFVLFVTANWAVCTLIDGKGRFSEIAATFSYSLIPYIASIYINVFLSNILTLDEAIIMNIVSTLCFIWTLVVLFCGFYAIHQYTVTKTAISIVATVLGVFLVVFLIILFFGLLQQAFSFIESVYNEARLRF